MKILGISAFYHDSAAAIIQDGVILAAAQEERFSRIKNDAGFPAKAIAFCLHYSGIRLSELDAVVFYDKPFLKFERLLETYYAFAPAGLGSFLKAMPVWIKEKLFLKRIIYKELGLLGRLDKRRVPLLFPEHHLSHAASAFYPSGFDDAAILTLDGVGEWATISICKGSGKDITILKQVDFPHSLGLLYSAFTYYCGFAVNNGEYKLMGLAPYGNRDGEDCRRMVDLIKTKLVTIKEDGSLFLHQEYFGYATGDRMVKDRVWERLFGFPRRPEDGFLEQRFCDMALAVQEVTEEVVMRLAREAKRLTGSENLCMAGGVALNCVANGKLDRAGLFKQLFIQPAAGDAGGALGAALAAHYIYFGQERRVELPDALRGSLLGPEFGETDILPVARKYGCPYRRIEGEEALVKETARLIAEGSVIGWFQGRTEFGPRALGARSILADPRDPGMQKKLNLSIKNREGFRPFAPAVLAEEAQNYFEIESASPYMLLVKEVKKSRQVPLPADFAGLGWADKLAFRGSDLPAITHVDHSARVQTVDRLSHPLFWQLLHSFKELTGCPVLINTSFNIRDEPIVNSPEDAVRCFLQTKMDFLVAGPFIFSKKEYLATKT
jgi:carbamoyltransferase